MKFFYISKLPQKRCQLLQSVFEEDEAEEAAKKKIKNQKKIGQFFFFNFEIAP